jgi:hypothetical protein
VESFYATNQTYAGAAADTDVTGSGVFGAGNGQASLPAATATGYTIVGQSSSGNRFTITKAGSTVTRTCSTKSSGACPSTGNW